MTDLPAIDWSLPIEWDDGTPTELVGTIWAGQAHVRVDQMEMPLKLAHSALRSHHAPIVTTNVIAHTGAVLDGYSKAFVRNVGAADDTTHQLYGSM